MAKIPFKYCIELANRVNRYVDYARIRNVYLYQNITSNGEIFYDVWHYNTFIIRLYPSSNVSVLFGGYSASDRDIINSFLEIYGMSGKCHIHKGELYIDQEYE